MLTAAQLTTLKTDLAANTNTVLVNVGGTFTAVAIKDVVHNDDTADAVAAWYNGQASPNWTVWKQSLTITQIGNAFDAGELGNRTSLENTRLQTLAAYLKDGVNPSLAGVRQFFDDIFSGTGGALTRAALLALYKRLATRTEKLLSTTPGNGSDATPATPTFLGSLVASDIKSAWTAP